LLEQVVRLIILTWHYRGETNGPAPELSRALSAEVEAGTLDSQTLLAKYCKLLHQRHCTYEEVARRTGLARRTVKKYILSGMSDGRRETGDGKEHGDDAFMLLTTNVSSLTYLMLTKCRHIE
jgi:predicted transcriptional regulator